LASGADVVAGQKMCRRVLDELEWNPSAVSLLQSVDKTAMAVFEILMDNFDLAVELDTRLRCSCGTGASLRENNCAAKKYEAGENRTAKV